MIGSNLEKRSVKLRSSWRDEPFERVDQLADGLDLRLHVHADDDVELVFDVGDKIEHGQAVPFEILGEARRFGHRRALLVEGLDEFGNFGEGLLAVGHGSAG